MSYHLYFSRLLVQLCDCAIRDIEACTDIVLLNLDFLAVLVIIWIELHKELNYCIKVNLYYHVVFHCKILKSVDFLSKGNDRILLNHISLCHSTLS